MIRWGILGCGDIARKRVADAIRQDNNSQLVAACRRDAARLNAFCDEFNIRSRYSKAEHLLRDDGIDAVYVATPVDLHCQHTLQAVAQGKHVLVEKPMAITVAECDRMIDHAAQRAVHLAVAYYRRFYPVVIRIKQLIEDGAIGQPRSIAATTGNPNRFASDNWRVVRARGGGGPLMDIGSHRLDLFHQLFGPVTKVHACMSTLGSDYEAEDSATLLLKFATQTHGVLQCYFGTTNTPDDLSVIGSDGRLYSPCLNEGILQIETPDGATQERHPPHRNLHAPLIGDFTDAIRYDRQPTVPGELGRAVNEILETAYRDAC